MRLFAYMEDVGSIREEIRKVPRFARSRPARRTALGGFFAHVRHAARLLVEEPEIALFSLLQWLAVVLVYAAWQWGCSWSWQHIEDESVFDLALALWSLACLALVAAPVAFFTACIGTVHFLRQEGESSTLLACMRRVAPRMGPLWGFTFIDVGFTALQALDRLPGRRTRTAADRALSEALYYAWKVATVGILPAILADRTLLQAARESVDVVRKRPAEVAMLRVGYTAACWLLGLAAFAASGGLLHANSAALPEVAGGGFWLWAPLVIALGLVHLLVRPIYVIASCDLYHDYRGHPRSEPAALPDEEDAVTGGGAAGR